MELKNAQSDTLLNDIAIGAATGTLTGGNFGTPTTPIYLVFDYDVSAKYEVKLVTVAGANMTVMSHISGANVVHTAGCKVGRMMNSEILDDLGVRDGWTKPDGVWARAGANSITVPTGAASIYAVGDKIKLTDTTTKYFYVTAVADTTLTVTGGTDYTLVGAISLYYYSHSNPVGFPELNLWTAPSLQNSWTNYNSSTFSNAGYMKDQLHQVCLRGLIKGGTSTDATLIFTLPAGYRPAKTSIVGIMSLATSTYTPGSMTIDTDGTLTIYNVGNTWLSLEDIRFSTLA